MGRLAFGRWAGLVAVLLCLITGYFYGSLFFTPIDVPFMATMTWAILSIVLMTRQVLPSWGATCASGLFIGLAMATRTGGIIALTYLAIALSFCSVEFATLNGQLTLRYLAQLGGRSAAVVVLAVLVAISLWPWLQIGSPFQQYQIALLHFANLPTSFDFMHWGERVWSNDLPRTYVPAQLFARLPLGFLFLLAVSLACGVFALTRIAREALGRWRGDQPVSLRTAILKLARGRAAVVVCAAVAMPLVFLILQRATLYDGTRHTLFVIPLLAVLAGAGFKVLIPWLARVPFVAATAIAAYVAHTVHTLALLHPFEYVDMNAAAGGTKHAYGRFDLDYWSVAAKEASRRLEQRLAYDAELASAEMPPSIAICIPWREWAVAPMLERPWIIQVDPKKADYIIETERWRCADKLDVVLIDEVRRMDRTFAWTYARRQALHRFHVKVDSTGSALRQ
jgi:hypothetical protein